MKSWTYKSNRVLRSPDCSFCYLSVTSLPEASGQTLTSCALLRASPASPVRPSRQVVGRGADQSVTGSRSRRRGRASSGSAGSVPRACRSCRWHRSRARLASRPSVGSGRASVRLSGSGGSDGRGADRPAVGPFLGSRGSGSGWASCPARGGRVGVPASRYRRAFWS